MDQQLRDKIITNYEVAKDNIELAQDRSESNNEVKIVAVTKYVDVSHMEVLLDAGVDHIGESRVKDAALKFEELEKKNPGCLKRVKKHLIGHLQSNKVGKAIQIFDCIQSIDSLKIATKINNISKHNDKIMDVMIQINIGRENQKYGILPEEIDDLIQKFTELDSIKLIGLMCIAPKVSDDFSEEDLKSCFIEMRRLKDRYGLNELSMGMSADYELAVNCGATFVRIGSSLFN